MEQPGNSAAQEISKAGMTIEARFVEKNLHWKQVNFNCLYIVQYMFTTIDNDWQE